MRAMYLRAPAVGIGLVLLAIPSLIILIVLSLFSRRVAKVFNDLFRKDEVE